LKIEDGGFGRGGTVCLVEKTEEWMRLKRETNNGKRKERNNGAE